MIDVITMKIPTQAAFSYPIMIESNLAEQPDNWLPPQWQTKRIVIITDDNVNALYGEKLSVILHSANPLLFSFPAGEKFKTAEIKLQLEQKMVEAQCNRDTLILALGGGVVGDLAGFIAATFMRGVSYIQIPTTLLAIVDSSVGGKTSINLPQGKNLIGAFWQPICVVADLNFLTTLPQEHMINGLIEAIKMFATNNAEQFYFVHANMDAILQKHIPTLKKVIQQAIQIKVAVVSADERESHQRMILNFGHTIGHALEKETDYTLLHGYAVALGMLVEAKVAELLGYFSSEDYQVIQALMAKLKIAGNILKEMNLTQIIQATYTDKKNKANQVRYILLKKIGLTHSEGNNVAFPVVDDIILKALIEVRDSYVG